MVVGSNPTVPVQFCSPGVLAQNVNSRAIERIQALDRPVGSPFAGDVRSDRRFVSDGGLLPGGLPFFYAADIVGVRGLGVAFWGYAIGAVITITVWISPLHSPPTAATGRVETRRDST